MNHVRVTQLAVLLTLLVSPLLARAQTTQPWLEDRRFRSGIGIRAGNLELHPGIAGEVGYDSNFLQGAGVEEGMGVYERVVPSARFRITPSLTVSTLQARRYVSRFVDGQAPPPPKIDFSAKLVGRLNQLFALDGDFAEGDKSRTLLDGEASAAMNILPFRPWGGGVRAGVVRVAQPSNLPGLTELAFDRTTFNGGAELRWRPGGGVLRWSLGYEARFTHYDQESYGLNLLEHALRLQGRWRFFPKTAVLYEGEVAFKRYTQDDTRQLDSTPISTLIGLNGLITPRLGVIVMGGWKATFIEEDPQGRREDFDGLVGRAELAWYISGTGRLEGDGGGLERGVGLSTLRLGYQRSVEDSGIANYFRLDRFYADISYAAAGVFVASLQGGVALVDHPVPRDREGNALTLDGQGINEVRPDVRLFLEYRLTNTLALFGNAGYSASLEDNYLVVNRSSDSIWSDNLQYTRFTTMVGARWFM